MLGNHTLNSYVPPKIHTPPKIPTVLRDKFKTRILYLRIASYTEAAGVYTAVLSRLLTNQGKIMIGIYVDPVLMSKTIRERNTYYRQL